MQGRTCEVGSIAMGEGEPLHVFIKNEGRICMNVTDPIAEHAYAYS